MIVGLGHQARVGKDTVAEFLVNGHGFKRLAFADALKAMAYDIDPFVGSDPTSPLIPAGLSRIVDTVGWEQAKELMAVRHFLQNLGLAARAHIDVDVWVDIVLNQAVTSDKPVVITDVRFPNEFDTLRSAGAVLVKVTRPGVESNAGTHTSETALADAPWDHVVVNDGSLRQLYQRVIDTLGLA